MEYTKEQITKDVAIEILTETNLWRRGEGRYDTELPSHMPYSPKEFGLAIDFAIEQIQSNKTLVLQLDKAIEDGEYLAYQCEKKGRKETIDYTCEWLYDAVNDGLIETRDIEVLRARYCEDIVNRNTKPTL